MNTIQKWYDFVLQQMAAESYFENVTLSDPLDVRLALSFGNNRRRDGELLGNTRFTDDQADQFLQKYQIIHQLSENPTGSAFRDHTGLSATLIQKRGTDEFTLAIRSTEFRDGNQGGDWGRDGYGGADGSLFNEGLAFAQLDSLEKYYAYLQSRPDLLPPNAILNVTGYSLGVHLATVFTQDGARSHIPTSRPTPLLECET